MEFWDVAYGGIFNGKPSGDDGRGLIIALIILAIAIGIIIYLT